MTDKHTGGHTAGGEYTVSNADLAPKDGARVFINAKPHLVRKVTGVQFRAEPDTRNRKARRADRATGASQ